MNMLSIFFVTIILSWWIYQQVKPSSKHFFQHGHFSCSKTDSGTRLKKYVDVAKSYSKMLVGLRYHEPRRKIQMAVAQKMSKLQVQPRLLSWSTIIPSLAHQVTNRFFSFKKRTWVMTSLCPLSRYRPLSLMTSHTMTSVSWNRERGSMGLALVSIKLLPWDWKDYLRAHFLSLWISWMNNARDIASPKVQTDKCTIVPAWDTFATPDLTRFFTLTAPPVLYTCLQPLLFPQLHLCPQLLSLPSSGYGQRPHLKHWTFQCRSAFPMAISVKGPRSRCESLTFEPDTSLPPRWSYCRAVTAALCPLKVMVDSPLRRLKTRIAPSSYPIARCNPSGEGQRQLTCCLRPLRIRTCNF